jgi:O-antigen/teichoic acid export membrane protein
MAAKKMKGLLELNFLYSVYFFLVHFQALQQFNLTRLLSLLLLGMIVRSVVLTFLTIAVYRKVGTDASSVIAIRNARSLWLHLGLYDLLQNVFRFIDKFILSIFLSAGLYAVYFNGSQTAEVPLLPYLLGAVASSVLIQLSNDKNASRERAARLMHASGKLLSCIVFPLFFFLLFFSRELFVVLLSEKYLSSVAIFTVAIFVVPLRAYNFTLLLQHFHKGALINKGALLDLAIALALMYPMYQLFHLPGIALSFVISTYVQVCYYLYHIMKVTGASLEQLLPIKNWLTKLVVFGVVLLSTYLLASGFLVNKISVLIAGFVVMTLASLFSLQNEYKGLKNNLTSPQLSSDGRLSSM